VNRRMGLAGSMGTWSLMAMAVSASSPMVVLVGGVVTMYSATGAVGVPVSFLVLAAALAPALVGFAAAARHVGQAATTYAILGTGLGRVAGTAGVAVALVSYAAVEASLFGLVGLTAASHMGGRWWAWALLAGVVVTVVSRLRVSANAVFLGAVVVAQLVVVGSVIWTGTTAPADGSLSWAGLAPSTLAEAGWAGLGALAAFGFAAFIGVETIASYGEEARSPKAVARATLAALVTLGLLYVATPWALASAVGPGRVVDAARDPRGPLPWVLLGGYSSVGVLVLVAAIGAAMLAFHNLAARYLYALGREGLLPQGLGRVGRGTGAGAPATASMVQSVVMFGVVVVVAVTGGDPFSALFIPASTLAAIGVLSLLVACSGAAARFFASGGGANEGRRVATIATVGTVTGGTVWAFMVVNLNTLLGVGPGAASTRVLPGLIAATAMAGGLWGLWLRRHRPDVYHSIGQRRPDRLARLDPRLAELKV
jgi:amino acid transporter